ncbi:MAG: DUF3570 domain-containing protein [Gammaproteobacteria bacterium]|nr:DUF3570 domain-containing protein [Gammaproteobacteria bacterium]
MAVTNQKRLAIVFYGLSLSLQAAVLPEDRADALYHSYDGGGVEVTGPSVLVRKGFGENVSVSANYYVDSISSASIDVVTTASRYSEERTEHSVGIDYLHADTIMSLGMTRSTENDYEANTTSFNLTQEVFGNMTTVSMGYSIGSDTVGKRDDASFSKDVKRHHFRVGLSQIMTKNTLLGLSFETISDEGYLNNPYRSVRYIDSGSAIGYSYESEVYPRTRTSNAAALRGLYYLPYRASLHAEYRAFQDSWGIAANHIQLGYTHPYQSDWIFDLKYRLYSQTRADFYSDLFAFSQAQNFLARDKELSTFDSSTISLGVSYEITPDWSLIDRASINFKYDRIVFDYKDFRDLSQSGAVGSEPLYNFSADVIQLYFSAWY